MFDYVLLFVVALSAVMAIIQENLYKSIIILGFESFSLAAIFHFLLATDVAATQAILGAALIPGLFIVALYKTTQGRDE
jgi:energy-converting hydrogenase B subunit D